MENSKTTGIHGMLPGFTKEGGQIILKPLRILLNSCLNKKTEEWNSLLTVSLHGKTKENNLKNYKPTSLLAQLYKLLSKILINQLENKLKQFRDCG